MKVLLLLAVHLTCGVLAAEAGNNQAPAKQKYVGVTAAQVSQRVVRVYRVAENGTVEILDNGGDAKADWQPIGIPRRTKQKCIGITSVRISPRVIRVYRALSDGSLHIIDDGGNPKTNTWQPIGVNAPGRRARIVGITAVRISQRVVRVYRTLENGKVEILDDGGNPKATWQPIRK